MAASRGYFLYCTTLFALSGEKQEILIEKT